MLFRYAAGSKAGSGGLGMEMLRRDMVGESRLGSPIAWLRLMATGDKLAARADLASCDSMPFSSEPESFEVFLLKKPILGFFIDSYW